MKLPEAKYYFDEENSFIIENYQWAKAFSNYLPGIAGKFGIPMWAYYVNRGQGLCCLGVKNKDGQILEFESFNKAIQTVSSQCFQTFILLDSQLYIPFKKTDNSSITQNMTVKSHEFEICEINSNLGLCIKVTYFPIVKFRLPVFARKVTITDKNNIYKNITVIDGLSRIIPYGTDRHCTQNIPRHIEGMCKVDFLKKIPVFRLKQAHDDIEEIKTVAGGNFYLTIDDDSNKVENYIIDPEIIFADSANYDYPWNLKCKKLSSILNCKQVSHNKTPSAFSIITKNDNSKSISFTSLLGSFSEEIYFIRMLNNLSVEFIDDKQRENKSLIDGIKQNTKTISSNRIFDEYVEQTFLENVMRGGIPVNLSKSDNNPIPFYIYARQNGDLERDYHKLLLEPTFYSQGEGHYRSINQNRRCDSFFFPFIKDFNIKFYLSLIQLDGNNPLEITPVSFSPNDVHVLNTYLDNKYDASRAERIKKIIEESFTPGTLAMELLKNNLENFEQIEIDLSEILQFCKENKAAEPVDGYQIDHWSYNLDLIDNFLLIYPDKFEYTLFDDFSYSFYDSSRVVTSRKLKYCKTANGIRQYNSTKIDKEKDILINSRKYKNSVHIEFGNGTVYYTNLFEILIVIFINRISNLDPFINGLEMATNKPGWNDSLNGLPGLIGSSLGQAIELERLCKNMIEWLEQFKLNKYLSISPELNDFIEKLNLIIESRIQQDITRFEFWDQSHLLKEEYREITKFGISGDKKTIAVNSFVSFFKNSLALLNEKYSRKHEIFNKENIPYMYFINELTDYEEVNSKIIPKSFLQKTLPLFLEGPTHYLKVRGDKNKKIYDAVKSSSLYDRKLKMYKVCESLKNATYEIGRVHAWGSGWIENESIYTHMEFKYLIELLRCGHYKEFFRDIKTILMPFLMPEVYGRSTTENVSFVVSSAFDDESMHGQGLQPRLSGVTAEMLNIWQYMTVGLKPFFINEEDKLCLQLCPIIDKSFFTNEDRYLQLANVNENITVPKNSFAFTFLGEIFVIYYNPKRLNTYDSNVQINKYKLFYKNGEIKNIKSSTVSGNNAADIRNLLIKRIEATVS